MQKVYKLNHQVTSTTAAAASVTMARKGRITGILCNGRMAASGVTSGSFETEVSFANAHQVLTNDTIGPIASFTNGSEGTTSGMRQLGTTNFVPVNIGVNAGDRIYLNVYVAGTVSASVCNVYLYVEE